jgi:hypothetical protein
MEGRVERGGASCSMKGAKNCRKDGVEEEEVPGV